MAHLLNINEALYTIIPQIALLANIFLLGTLYTAKKDPQIKAFMGILITFILWTAGSLFMRMGIYPGYAFWWRISLAGIFMVPYMYFLLASAFTEQKGHFLKLVLGIFTALIVLLNFFDVFLTTPVFETKGNEEVLHYSVTPWAIIPILLAILIFACIISIVRESLRRDGLPASYFAPLFLGVLIMVIGVLIDTVPILNTLPCDTLACAINAVCIYYAFYKKRVYAMSQITSRGAMYVISLVVTGFLLKPLYEMTENFLNEHFAEVFSNPSLVIALICSGFAVMLFLFLNRLHEDLFTKDQNHKDFIVRSFSTSVNSTLKLDDVLTLFHDAIKREVDCEHLFICMYSADEKVYETIKRMESLERHVVINEGNPLVQKLKQASGGILYSDFKKTTLFRSMWESEKELFNSLQLEYIIPFKDSGELIGFAMLSGRSGRKAYSNTDIEFTESMASVASIALKNASLYRDLEHEAKHDSLTSLLNRNTFSKELESLFRDSIMKPLTLIMFNLDDFSLYNELYGSNEGDLMLIRFADILRMVVGHSGLISRYGGKEFAVILPCMDQERAKMLAENVRAQLADQIERSHETTKRFLTFSAGICTYPSVAYNMSQLTSYANMAVFKAKQNGKDQIIVYSNKDNSSEDVKNKKDHMYELTSTVFALTAAIDAKDHYTFNHSRCVSEYSTKLASFAGLPEEHIEIIRQAGLLHDIGKIGIPDVILSKTGKLTEEEYAIMRQHVERSIEIIRHLPSLDYVIPSVIGHHEFYNGEGYPRGLSGEDIPIGARILAIADSFDAMVSRRSYKDNMPVDKALTEISLNLGTQFDPELGALFVKLVRDKEIEVIEY